MLHEELRHGERTRTVHHIKERYVRNQVEANGRVKCNKVARWTSREVRGGLLKITSSVPPAMWRHRVCYPVVLNSPSWPSVAYFQEIVVEREELREPVVYLYLYVLLVSDTIPGTPEVNPACADGESFKPLSLACNNTP